MGHLVITANPIGGLDTDSADAVVQDIDCRDMLNMRNSYSYLGIEMGTSSLKGNLLVSYDLGNVKHKCLGAVEDIVGKSVVYFLWAADNNHKILRYFIGKITPTSPYGSIENIITFDFGWKQSTNIHSKDIVKGLLYWVDPVPKKINLDKANLNFKKKSWTVRLPVSFVAPTGILNITVKDFLTGANVAMINAFTTAGKTRKETFESLAQQINTGNISTYLFAETCGCDLLITETQANRYTFVLGEPEYRVTSQNWYGPNLVARFFDAAKWAPGCNPTYEYAQDDERKYNFVDRHVWQFRLGYKYDDAETSTLGPISQIAVNNQLCNSEQRQRFNICVVDFNNPDAIDPNMWVILKEVAIYVRERNTGEWRKIESLEPCDFFDIDSNGNPIGKYIFDNILQTQSVDAAFAALPYDRMPREANSQKFISDRLVYGAPLDDYNAPDCGNMDIETTYGEIEKPEYFEVSCIIRICNPTGNDTIRNDAGISKMPYIVGFAGAPWDNSTNFYDDNKRGCLLRNKDEAYATWGGAFKYDVRTNQSGFDQWIPLGGFLVYSAGTPFYAISRQYHLGGLASDENGAFLTEGSKSDDIKKYLGSLKPGTSAGEVYQRVTIRLPKGKHIIRVASHLVSDGDVLKRGEIFDLRNNLYHLTSTNVWRIVAPDGQTTIGTTELEIDVQGDMFFGEIMISDRMLKTDSALVARAVYGYLLDIPLFNVLGQVPKCIGIEKQTVIMDPGTLDIYNDNLPQTLERGAYSTYTDHNGYFFFNIYYNSQTAFSFFRAYGANDEVISKRSDTKYYGDIGQIYDNKILPGGDTIDQGVLGSGFIYNNARDKNWSQSIPDDQYYNVLGQEVINSVSGSVDITQVVRPIILLNTNPLFRPNYTTVIKGRIVDANGNGICCANAILANNSRQDKSLDSGSFDILCFADGRHSIGRAGGPQNDYFPLTIGSLNGFSVRYDNLIYNTGDCFVEFPGQNSVFVNIFPFGANPGTVPPPYSSTAWYVIPDIIGNLVNANLVKAAKRGSKYLFSVRFQDGPGRMCTNVPLAELEIPFFTENGILGYPILKWTLPPSFKPPKWAHNFQLMRTVNLLTSDYLQWLVNDVKYVLATNEAGEPIETTYGNFDATQIWVSVANLAEYARQHPDSQVGYEFVEGQKIRFITDENNALFNIFSDFTVIGYASTGQYLKLVYNQDLGEIKTSWRFEVYQKRKILEDEKYFECGECFPCTLPDTDNNDFSIRTGFFTWGDTYWVKRIVPIRDANDIAILAQTVSFMESVGINDFYPSDDEDVGRIGEVDNAFGEVRRTDILRISDNYATRLNGLSAFRNIDDRSVGLEFGPIRKLAISGFVLLAICENHTVSNYIGRVLAKSAGEDDTLQALTGQFLGDTRPLQEQMGTQNPESVSEIDGYVYALDAKRGLVWRYAGNGQEAISVKHNMRNYFMAYQRTGVWLAPATYDKAYKEYIITIYEKLSAAGRYQLYGQLLPLLKIDKETGLVVGDSVFLTYTTNGEQQSGYFDITFILNGDDGSFYYAFGQISIDMNTDVFLYYKGPGKTVAWCEPKKKFTTRYSYLPEAYGNIDNDMVSFSNGGLWIHDKNELRNNFYGVQYTSQFQPIFNGGEKNPEVKMWLAMTIENNQADGKSGWYCPDITNTNGQRSRILLNLFEKKEQYFHAEFKFNLNTPNVANPILNGSTLRSSNLSVLFENADTFEFYIIAVFVGVEISKRNTN